MQTITTELELPAELNNAVAIEAGKYGMSKAEFMAHMITLRATRMGIYTKENG